MSDVEQPPAGNHDIDDENDEHDEHGELVIDETSVDVQDKPPLLVDEENGGLEPLEPSPSRFSPSLASNLRRYQPRKALTNYQRLILETEFVKVRTNYLKYFFSCATTQDLLMCVCIGIESLGSGKC